MGPPRLTPQPKPTTRAALGRPRLLLARAQESPDHDHGLEAPVMSERNAGGHVVEEDARHVVEEGPDVDCIQEGAPYETVLAAGSSGSSLAAALAPPPWGRREPPMELMLLESTHFKNVIELKDTVVAIHRHTTTVNIVLSTRGVRDDVAKLYCKYLARLRPESYVEMKGFAVLLATNKPKGISMGTMEMGGPLEIGFVVFGYDLFYVSWDAHTLKGNPRTIEFVWASGVEWRHKAPNYGHEHLEGINKIIISAMNYHTNTKIQTDFDAAVNIVSEPQRDGLVIQLDLNCVNPKFCARDWFGTGCAGVRELSYDVQKDEFAKELSLNSAENTRKSGRDVKFCGFSCKAAAFQCSGQHHSGISIRATETTIPMSERRTLGFKGLVSARPKMSAKTPEGVHNPCPDPVPAECIICFDAEAVIVFNCGHVVHCWNCHMIAAKHLYPGRIHANKDYFKGQDCPLCRQASKPCHKTKFKKRMYM